MATKKNGKRVGKSIRQIYWDGCSVCQYMKGNPAFRLRVMQSAYFEPNGRETLAEVVHGFGDPFPLSTVYAHMQRHQVKDRIKAQERYAASQVPEDTVALTGVIEGQVMATGQHEAALDEFVAEGREMMARKEMKPTATTFLQAIKIRADIEKSTKDRRLEAAKAFFANPNATPQPTRQTEA